MKEALILCGGLGSRLKSLLPDKQKCAAEIDGKPFIEHLIQYFASQGINRFILCVGHLSETLQEAIAQAHIGVEIVFSKEEQPLGTGGALRQGAALIQGGSFIAMNGDSICPLDLKSFIKFHEASKGLMSIALSTPEGRDDCGNVQLAADGRIVSFNEKSGAASGLVNAGVYIMGKEALALFPAKEGKLSLETDAIPALLQRGGVFGFRANAPLLDIGTPDRYAKAAEFLRRQKL